MQRVSVVGNSGSGKSRLARRIAARIGAPCVELDAIHHLPKWEPIDNAEFVHRLAAIAATDTWVIDGNYSVVVSAGPVWQRADTVVFLDLPRWVVMSQIARRTVRRMITREELWNGNRERVRDVLSWDAEHSIIRWAWENHRNCHDRYSAAMTAPEFAHLSFVRLSSRAEVDAWAARIGV